MNPQLEPCGLQCPDGREAQLLSVQVHGEILGLMLRLTVRQTWRNASGAPMATRLDFPLGWTQTLLDLHMERPTGTQTLGTVTRQSRQRCSATPGVLATGEQVTLQWRIGQLLHLQGSSLRVQLPAALVPRAPRAAQISLELHAPVAHGTVGCTSHELQRVRHANGLRLTLRAPQGLDKDLVLTVHGLRETAMAVASPDLSQTDACTVLLSASPRLAPGGAAAQPVRLKLLIDSSAAMPTERLLPVHSALDKLLAQLLPQDQLSYSRFGERVVHELPRLQVCTEAYVRRARALSRHTETEAVVLDPLAALQAVLAIADEDEQAVAQADILLITANPVWAIDAPLRALREAGHRLHVMALGAASDSLWRELAEASGGACETLAPGQHSLPTLMRLVERMRQLQTVHAWLALQGAELKDAQPPTPQRMADGDTLHLWRQARAPHSEQDLTGRPELQATLHWHAEPAHEPQSLPATPVLWDAQGDLARLCAAREALWHEDEAERARLRQQHRLTTPDMRLLAPAMAAPASPEASNTAPTPQRPKVLPHAPSLPAPADTHALPAVLPTTAPASASLHSLRPAPPRHADLAGWLSEPQAPGNPLTALLQGFEAQTKTHTHFRAALSGTLQQLPTRFLDALVLQLARQAGNPGRVWALMLHWLHAEHGWPLTDGARALLAQELGGMPVALRHQLGAALARAAMPQRARAAA